MKDGGNLKYSCNLVYSDAVITVWADLNGLANRRDTLYEGAAMRGHSGSVDFDFEVERLKNKSTGQIIPISKDINISDEDPNFEYLLIHLAVEGESYYTPARTYGPPERCSPSEGETEVISVQDDNGVDWLDKLTKNELETVIELIEQYVQESAED